MIDAFGPRYANGREPDYTYSAAGRLLTRQWVRTVSGRLTTTYAYNGAGQVARINYNDSVTPGVTNTFDRLGRVKQINHGSNLIARSFNLAGQLLGESQQGLLITNRFDNFLRRTNLSLLNGGTALVSTHYGYDPSGRLGFVADGTNVAGFGYLANSPLVEYVRFTNSGTLRLTTQKGFDLLNRLTNVASWNSVFTNSFAYLYNTANQRTRVTLADGSYWVYEYDRLGQVTGGRKYWSDGSSVAGQQFSYTYDDIGNRKTAASGGNEIGSGLRTSSYTANNLNEYTQRTVPGYRDVLGAATNSATVTVNFQPTSRKGEYFRAELPVDNVAGAVWQAITNIAVLNQSTNDLVTTNSGNLFLPQTPEAFSYDADGNLTQDGRWQYTWDAENRLTQVQSLSGNPTASKRRVTYEYDWHGRRARRQEFDGSSGTYVLTSDQRMVYDGWQCIGDLTTNLVLQRAYVWGLDLSGTLSGAGGVGGLLWLRSGSNGTHYASYDGNGNVTALAAATSGSRSGLYEYGPFGQTLRLEGVATDENPWRFSTKRTDVTADLLLYEYRVLNSSNGRWPSRDPINELGFQRLSAKQSGRVGRDDGNLYHFVRNNPVNAIDVLGLALWSASLEEESRWGYCCCGKAGRISAKAIPTGVKSCSADSTVDGVDHGWLEIDGWSADFNTGGSILWSTGTVNIPTDYAKKDSKKCEDVLLSPCRYDFKKFRANVKAEAEKDKANPPTYTVIPFIGDQCFSWANGIIGRAMQKSGPCGGEVSAE